MEFNFKIREDRLLAGKALTGNSGNVNVYTCNFEIAENTNFTWLCVFKQGDRAYQQVIENGKCVIPKEVLESAGVIQIGCYGTDGDMRISTNWLEFCIFEGAYCEATMPSEPTPDLWETLVMNSLPYIGENGNWYVYDKVKKIYKDSGKASRGEKGRPGDKGDAGLDGLDGKDGYTPQRGVDYWTEEDIASIIDDIYDIKHDIVQEAGTDTYRAISQNATSLLFSNALKNVKTGETVVVTDISPAKHKMKVSARSKNLFPYPHYDSTKTANGITFTDNGDGSVTINGTASVPVTYYIVSNVTPFTLTKGVTYTLSGCPSGGSYNTYRLVLKSAESDEGFIDTGDTKVVVPTNAQYYCYIRVEAGTTLTNVVVKPMLTEGTEAVEYTPYIDVTTTTINKYGSNLFNSAMTLERENNGITTKIQPDGGVLFTGTATATTRYFGSGSGVATQIILLPGTYTISGHRQLVAVITAEDGTTGWYKNTFTVTKKSYLKNLLLSDLTIGQEFNEIIYPSLAVGKVAKYEPYIEPTLHTPSADGNVEGVTSVYPSTTLLPDTEGVVIACEYNRDINKAYEELTNAIISLGGNV